MKAGWWLQYKFLAALLCLPPPPQLGRKGEDSANNMLSGESSRSVMSRKGSEPVLATLLLSWPVHEAVFYAQFPFRSTACTLVSH